MRTCAVILTLFLLTGCAERPFERRTLRCDSRHADGILMLEWRVGVITHGGTAFVLRHKGKDYVITTAHTVEDKSGRLHLMDATGTPVPFLVKRRLEQEGVDAVAFEVTSLPDSVRRFQAATAAIGGVVEAYGYPASTTGRKCVRAPGRAVTRVLEATCPIKNGMSGGPLLDADRKVVGVASSRVLRNDGKEFSSHADMADVLTLIGE